MWLTFFPSSWQSTNASSSHKTKEQNSLYFKWRASVFLCSSAEKTLLSQPSAKGRVWGSRSLFLLFLMNIDLKTSICSSNLQLKRTVFKMFTAFEISHRCLAMSYENNLQIYTNSIILEITVHIKVKNRFSSKTAISLMFYFTVIIRSAVTVHISQKLITLILWYFLCYLVYFNWVKSR